MGNKLDDLLENGPVAINIGVQDFMENLKIQGSDVLQVDWAPPAVDDAEMLELLDKLL